MADGGQTDAGQFDGDVPEETRTGGAAGFLAACLSAFAAEAGLTLALADGVLPGGWIGWGAGHVAVAATLAAWTWRRRRRRVDERFSGLLAIGTAFLGPSGPLCVGLSAAAHAVFRRYATGFHDWYLSLFPESQSDPAQELYELIVTGRERAGAAAVDSFTDVMTVGSPQQKQAVIALVSRHFRPSFTPALRLGLADSDPSVRVQAATATARVEHEFNERWLKLERAADSAPDSAAARHALARHLDDYAFCGLLDANREQELRRKALDYYRAALAAAPAEASAGAPAEAPAEEGLRNDLGRLLLRVGLVAEAAETLAPAAARTRDRRLLAWYAETLFRLRRFDELRVLCRARAEDFADSAAIFDALGDVVALWTGAGPAESGDGAQRGRLGVAASAAA